MHALMGLHAMLGRILMAANHQLDSPFWAWDSCASFTDSSAYCWCAFPSENFSQLMCTDDIEEFGPLPLVNASRG